MASTSCATSASLPRRRPPTRPRRLPPRRRSRASTATPSSNSRSSRLGARRSSWNAADLRGECERIVADVGVVADGAVRRELTEDLTARAVAASQPLLGRDDVPDHVRALTSRNVLAVEADIVDRLITRAEHAGAPAGVGAVVARRQLDPGAARRRRRAARHRAPGHGGGRRRLRQDHHPGRGQ